ncbi:putative LRAT domain-containing protein [Helianthus annuus]|nr:putative LRAT domain-containing protein [Helianthus annuus]KAJ0937229.1 putative LRAT domain-containing protein [Helianthus annuus]
MGNVSHRVDRNKLKPGDHIYTWRAGFAYAHHGIYVGEMKVIHFAPKQENAKSSVDCEFWRHESGSGSCLCTYYCGFHQPKNGLIISCLNCFIRTGSVYLYQYGLNVSAHVSKLRGGTSTTAPSDPPQVVIHRAIYLLNSETGFGKYDLVGNNCEDFALYCKTGLLVNVNSATGASGQVNAVINPQWKPVYNYIPTGLALNVVGRHYWKRYKTDIGVRHNVVKVAVEDVGSFR